ncbi:hypothetical protein EZS27_041760 [termite gut metagenome]|uniref:Uncharacterized protein n=1 Tax=termite gut metagenome TaxID=433724 RepID=A0A5J4PDR0_9ZZZZ
MVPGTPMQGTSNSCAKIRAEENYLNTETGKLELAETDPLIYVHGNYYDLGNKIGKFGWTVEKKK